MPGVEPVSDPGFLTLVRQHVRSIWSLELLLLMRADASRLWRVHDLVKELRASTELVRNELGGLQGSGLVEAREKGFQFAPKTAELETFCGQLADAYRIAPVTVIHVIASRDPVQSLANAFRLKGKDK